MVSTRSVKYKFSEGEKVLCYEPDPAKTKVLYNSKVLDICIQKDETGKKVVQFLIHFQGWNSTWDRFVTEEYVLKDTEENRQLQRELAESASLTATGCFRGGNLYKRERKKRTHKLTDRGEGGEAKRPPPPPPPPTLSSSHSDSDTSDHEEAFPLAVSNTLKSVLELDFQLITRHNKVLNLPAEPNAVSILEMFLKEYATSQMRLACNRKSHLRTSLPSNSHSMTLEGFCRGMNLCREVVDGLRVYMDFMLEKVLLYRQERGQHYLAMTIGVQREPIKIKEEDDSCPKNSMTTTSIKEENNIDPDEVSVIVGEGDRRRSLRSHTNVIVDSTLQNGRTTSRLYSGNGDAASTSKTENSIKNEMAPRSMTPREQEVLNRILSWSLLPERVRTQPPQASLVYGATHLARLFVKLPELLQHSNHSESKTNLLIDYLCNFMKYLEDHPEWFGEEHYRDNIYPIPPANESTSSKIIE